MAARPMIEVVPTLLRLNLGCSDQHLPGWLNVDVCPPADKLADLSQRWPWEDSSVDALRAWDFIEHLPNKVWTMNEAYRVLKPGGQFDIWVPTTDGRGAFQDPGHVSFWTPNDLFYYCDNVGAGEWERFQASLGVTCHFRVREQKHAEYPNRVWKLRAILEAIK
jgi:SAM-dependent methyltransferase